MPVLQVSIFDRSPVSPELLQRHPFQFIWFSLAYSFDFVLNVGSLSLLLSKVLALETNITKYVISINQKYRKYTNKNKF